MSARRRILPLFLPHAGCKHCCVFCNQRNITGKTVPVTPADVTAALAQLREPVDELAFYGGSFTALPEDTQTNLLNAAQPALTSGNIRCIRISTRPDAISDSILTRLRKASVETIELGAQSMDDRVLQSCGRGHSAADTIRAAKLIRAYGFRLALQMMTGLPGSSEDSDWETGLQLAALRPDAVRIYPTVILRDTELYRMWRGGMYVEHTVEDAVRICSRLLPMFQANGIPVIRLGLQPTEELNGGIVAGGAYHPAFGELVRSRIYLEKARVQLAGVPPGSDVVLFVWKGGLSQMVGQQRCNLSTLCAEFSLGSLRVAASETMIPGQLRLTCLKDREVRS